MNMEKLTFPYVKEGSIFSTRIYQTLFISFDYNKCETFWLMYSN
jgi:hypothetical protein